MARKKKSEQVYKPAVFISSPYDLEPTELDVTMLSDDIKRTIIDRPISRTTLPTGDYIYGSPYITSPYLTGSSSTVTWHPSTIEADMIRSDITSLRTWDELKKKFEKEEVGDVNVTSEEPFKGEHVVICKDKNDLTTDKILKTLSAVKGKLMLDIAPIHIKKIECKMTPLIRQHIVTASKRLAMYGKKKPIIARFDEYGNRLPDEISLDTINGITLKIVDPDDYGDYYLEMKAIEFPNTGATWNLEDLPF